MLGLVKNMLNPAWYKTQLNCYIQHVRKAYIRPGKPDFLFQMMVGVGIIGYSMPYLSTHIYMNREMKAIKKEALKDYSFH